MDRQRISKVWAAVTVSPRATVRALVETTGIPIAGVQAALVELQKNGHVLPAPAIGAPRKIIVGLYAGKAKQGSAQAWNKNYPIVGEVRGGYRDEPTIRLYESDAAA